ncbi:MAG: hypothetical protein CML39_05270 [Rhodobacteraceae bacterium]|nr:MAG: hypothetical protein CML39_05270 [Paracoccaceae bacterium]|tara:strand:+ start:1181 stop:1678 length:498 start_codon:yes stop_codon:yes gene_type:complete
MAEVNVKVGERTYTVECDPGEEVEVQDAASELNAESQKILGSIGKVPEVKLLLMAGLMLGGRLRILEENQEKQITQIKSLENQVSELREKSNLIENEAKSIKEVYHQEKTNEYKETENGYATVLQSILTKLEDLLLIDSSLPVELKTETNSELNDKDNIDQKELF